MHATKHGQMTEAIDSYLQTHLLLHAMQVQTPTEAMPRKRHNDLLYAFYKQKQADDSEQSEEEELARDFSLQNYREYTADEIDRLAMDNQSSQVMASQKASSFASQNVKKNQNSPYLNEGSENKCTSSNKRNTQVQSSRKDQDFYDEEISVEMYQKELFKGVSKKKASDTNTTVCIDVDNDEPIVPVNNARLKERDSSSNPSANMELILKEIKRQQKLEMEKMKKERYDPKLMQIEPRRLQTRKLNKRQKVVSKRTLELLAKKFDEYYAYENNFEYKGPKISILQIGQLFDIGSNTIQKLYAEWMDDPTFYDRLIRYDLRKKTPEKKLTVERLEHVARLIKQNPFMTQSELCVELNKIQDLKSMKDGQRKQINKTTVARLLRAGKFRKKRVRCVPKQKNTTKSLQKRYQFSSKYKELLDKHAKIYFLDESGFNLYMTREKAWARPNEQITVNCPISKGKRFSLIAIIGEEGLANWRIIEGTYRKYEYLDFIKELFEKLYELKQDQDREKWLIMDNCAIHDKEQTMKLAEKWNVNVMYLPAYSPQLNPIEMWFHEVKTKIRKINYSGERQLLQIMERVLKQYQDHDFSNYYHGSLKFIEKGLRKEKF